MQKKYAPGQIVIGYVTDPSGGNGNPRPLLLIQVQGLHARFMAISTDPTDDPRDPTMNIEWSADGSSVTGLRKWCRVVLLWNDWIDAGSIEGTSGIVTKAYLRKVIAGRQAAIDAAR